MFNLRLNVLLVCLGSNVELSFAARMYLPATAKFYSFAYGCIRLLRMMVEVVIVALTL